jgi:hypothetical protein
MQMIKHFYQLTDVTCLLFCRDDRDPVDLAYVIKSSILFFIFIIVLVFYYRDFIVLFYLVFYYDLIVVSYLVLYYLLYET